MTTRTDFLGDIINQLILRRKELGLTQDDIDAIMGNADRLCSKWECGDRSPTGFNLFCWVEVLQSTLKIIPNREEEK